MAIGVEKTWGMETFYNCTQNEGEVYREVAEATQNESVGAGNDSEISLTYSSALREYFIELVNDFVDDLGLEIRDYHTVFGDRIPDVHVNREDPRKVRMNFKKVPIIGEDKQGYEPRINFRVTKGGLRSENLLCRKGWETLAVLEECALTLISERDESEGDLGYKVNLEIPEKGEDMFTRERGAITRVANVEHMPLFLRTVSALHSALKDDGRLEKLLQLYGQFAGKENNYPNQVLSREYHEILRTIPNTELPESQIREGYYGSDLYNLAS